jgi:GTPase SAR1 family protein
VGADVEEIARRREQYKCPQFRILVIGRANAGKTTILEKVCHVAKGTQPMIIYDKSGKFDTKAQSLSSVPLGKKLAQNETHVTPSSEVS